MAIVTVPISKLDFDLQNPRYAEQSSQREALERILLDNPAKTIKLAEHIAANGQNPIDLIAAIETTNKRFIVLEGNRRTAVLKVLNKPLLLDSIPTAIGVLAFVRRMKQLANQVALSAINKTGLVTFKSREDADVWINLKHTGENEGAGTVPWDGTQRARFRKGDVGLNLLDFGKIHNWFTDEDLTERGAFPISTLNRLLGDPSIREALGLEIAGGILQSKVDLTELEKGVKQIVSDLASGDWNVTKLKSKADRQKYLHQLPSSSLPKREATSPAWIIDSQKNTTQAIQTSQLTKIRVKTTARTTLIPKNFIISTSTNSPRLAKIYKELKQLSIEKNENAVAVLLRTYIELSLDDFIAREKVTVVKKNIKAQQATLADKAISVAAHLKQLGKLDKAQEAIVHRLTGSGGDPKTDATSITTLHSFVHSRHASPIGSELKTIWDNIATFMQLITHV
ncbi:hypothetical protein ACO0LG_19645 [Undibacterium sp. Ji42W]|uniref:hypothetical protein n=1 Tax=Undibacterium sp. Ji42W TaxID=3413039 RepID=UPI003BF1C151